MIEPYTGSVKLNLKKASSLISKIEKMIDEERYCMDISQQINAVLGLLRKANEKVLESHLNTCGKTLNSANKNEKDKFIKEIMQLCSLSNRK